MTRITIQREGKEYMIEASGHSGYGTRGTDIVCASISTLMYSFKYYLDYKDIGHFIKLTDGYMKLKLKDVSRAEDGVIFLENGLKAIEESYGKYVEIEWGIKK